MTRIYDIVSIRRRYILALCIIGFISAMGLVVQNQSYAVGEKLSLFSVKLNQASTAARQIAFEGHRSVYANELSSRQAAHEALKERTVKLRDLFVQLDSDAASSRIPEAVVETWNHKQRGLKGVFSRYSKIAEQASATDVQNSDEMKTVVTSLETAIADDIEVSLKLANMYLATAVEHASGRAMQIGWMMLAITLIGLAAVGLQMFRPMEKRISESYENLKKSQGRAEAADRAKSEFLANMSHEIRTPMNGVLGMTELLTKTELTSKQRSYTEVISNSGTALLTVINDVLDFSRIDSGKLEFDPMPFNLRIAVEDVVQLVSSRVKEKNLEVLVRFTPGLPENLIADAGRIRQVVTNLVGNAVKFTHSGFVLVNIEGDRDGGMLRLKISVADTGIGIREDKVAKIFEKFEQVDNSSSRRYQGTGLGLATTKRIVEAMGGEIGVRSQFGKGSIFWFKVALPINTDVKERSTLEPDLQDMRVLITDDNAVNRDILREQVESWGMRPVLAVSGTDALRVLRQAKVENDPCQIAILDYHMPEMDGKELAEKIKMDPVISDTTLIMLTSLGQKGDGRALRDSGLSGYLIKPARASLLVETIKTVLRDEEEGEDRLVTRHVVAEDNAAVQMEEISAEPAEKRFTILVAEDNEVNQIVVEQMLETTPFKAVIAGNGEIVVEMFKENRFDLVLMDISMPKMDGYEATRNIRKYQQYTGERTPIIGLTAHAMKNDRKRCIEAGMDDYLSKPVGMEELDEMLTKWLEKSSRPVAAEAV